jgi:hypothetical protein
MRLLYAAALAVLGLSVGCAPAASSGGLWAQAALQQELALFRLTDAQRAAGARAYELSLADRQLVSERDRLDQLARACPDPSQALPISSGNRVRDGIRIQVQGDAARLATVGQLALADWQLRRAASTGDEHFCDLARATLAGAGEAQQQPIEADPFATPHAATVQRDAAHPGIALDNPPYDLALSSYVLGAVDTIRAAAPLPQYLAAVYGGTVEAEPAVFSNDRPAEQLVDQLAPAHPEWEPDALYAALRAR